MVGVPILIARWRFSCIGLKLGLLSCMSKVFNKLIGNFRLVEVEFISNVSILYANVFAYVPMISPK